MNTSLPLAAAAAKHRPIKGKNKNAGFYASTTRRRTPRKCECHHPQQHNRVAHQTLTSDLFRASHHQVPIPSTPQWRHQINNHPSPRGPTLLASVEQVGKAHSNRRPTTRKHHSTPPRRIPGVRGMAVCRPGRHSSSEKRSVWNEKGKSARERERREAEERGVLERLSEEQREEVNEAVRSPSHIDRHGEDALANSTRSSPSST